MKKILIMLAVSSLFVAKASAQLYVTQTGNTSFFSKTPAKDISAVSVKTLAVMNIKSKEVAVSIPNTSFEFPNKLMQEHFNEKYIESEKYPNSTFKGKIMEDVDLTKNGEYKVNVAGKLNIHGVELERTIPGTIIVKDGAVLITSDFKVKVADHKIEVPTLVGAEIAQEIAVTIDSKLLPKK